MDNNKQRNRSDTQKPIPGGPDKDKKDIDREFEQKTPHVHEDERANFKPGGMQNDPYRGQNADNPDSTRTNPL